VAPDLPWQLAQASGAGSPLPSQSPQLLGPDGAPPSSPRPSAAEGLSPVSAGGRVMHAPPSAGEGMSAPLGPGNMSGEGMSVPLGPGNMLLRSCVVRNTGWVVGLAIYTGRDCKVVLNASGAQSKRSRVEEHMNRDMLLLSLLLVLLCLAGALGMVAWLAQWPDVLALPYLGAGSASYAGVAGEGAINFFSLLILFQVLVPISLYISIELIRLGQTYFMARDRHMQDARWGAGAALPRAERERGPGAGAARADGQDGYAHAEPHGVPLLLRGGRRHGHRAGEHLGGSPGQSPQEE